MQEAAVAVLIIAAEQAVLAVLAAGQQGPIMAQLTQRLEQQILVEAVAALAEDLE
jgi:H+/gluconate symporter-like permease